MSTRVNPLKPINLCYNHQSAQFQLESYIICPDGQRLRVDPNRKICHVMDVRTQKGEAKRIVLYEDTPEKIKEMNEICERMNEMWMDRIRKATRAAALQTMPNEVMTDDQIETLSVGFAQYLKDTYEERKIIYEQQEKEKFLEKCRQESLEPKKLWVRITDGCMAIGALYIAYKIVAFIVKKKPVAVFFNIYSTTKSLFGK